MNLPEIAHYAENKTKIYIYSPTKEVEKLVLHTIHFLNLSIDFVSKSTEELNESDFLILSSNDIENITVFHPNIVLITDLLPAINTEGLYSNIVSGGILVYPDNAIVLESQLSKVENFFRKIPYTATKFTKNKGIYAVDTALGEVPLNTDNTTLINKIEGVRLFFQQLGVMEEEFYEALLNFE